MRYFPPQQYAMMDEEESTEEGALWKNKKERDLSDSMADLYAILIATEKLERLYFQDVISAVEYEPEAEKLISHFKTLVSSLKSSSVPSVEHFVHKYNINCPAAMNRLVTSGGVPATVEHRRVSSSSSSSSLDSARVPAIRVADCVNSFITAMDALKLKMWAKDQVYPLLTALEDSLSKFERVESGASRYPDLEGKVKEKVKDWMARLEEIEASHLLTEEESRQLLFDLEISYTAFFNLLDNFRTM